MRLPLSDRVPLRSTTAWPKFAKPQPLNVVYGRCTVPLTQADPTRKFWHISDGAIGGIETVYREGKPDKAVALHNTTDPVGQSIALLELASPLAANASLTAVVRGRIDPATGALIENPADVLLDILRLAGHDLSATALAEVRAACAGLTIAGLLSPDLTLRAQLAEIADSVGLLWSPQMPGIARRWPIEARPDGEPIHARWRELDLSEVAADARQDTLSTVLRVEFDWDWAANKARQSVTLQASTATVFGQREAALSAKWLTIPAQAIARGTAWLQAAARPRWKIDLQADLDPAVPPGGWFEVAHPLLPVSGACLALSAEWDWSNQRQSLHTERSVGPLPAVSVITVGGLFAEPDSNLRVSYADGVATLVIVDPNGAPIRDAVVTLGSQKGKTDRTGTVRFKIDRGTYPIAVEAAGFTASSAEITL